MRRPLIAGNWKMYKTINEAVKLVSSLKKDLADSNSVDIVLCPPYVTLDSVYKVIMDCNMQLGAQDLCWEKEGAFTGEISPIMLKDCGCEYVIIGHSERRRYFSETDQLVNKKTKAALDVGIVPIVCVGETLEEREADKATDVIRTQLSAGFAGFSLDEMKDVVIAYEPVWAIGTGKNATPDQAQAVHKFIRGWVSDNFSPDIARDIRIIYGGSVKPANIKELTSQPDIDGALVGGASLESASFTAIVKDTYIKPEADNV